MSGTPTPSTPTSHVAHLQPLLAFLQQQPYGTHRKTWEVTLCQPERFRIDLASLHITLPPPSPPLPCLLQHRYGTGRNTLESTTPSVNLLYKAVYCSYSRWFQ